MSVKCSVYVGASLDGFIAGPGGNIEWLQRPEFTPSVDAGLTFESFLSSVDALVMGRNTLETLLGFEEWPYGRTPIVVLTGRPLELPPHRKDQVRTDAGPPAEVVARLASQGAKHLYIDGGDTIQRFLRAGLIDEITVTLVPILVGGGISLFGSIGIELGLRLIETTPFDNGLVQLRYRVVRAAHTTREPA